MAPAADLAERLGLQFSDLTVLTQALVHSSYLHEQPSAGQSNERLEFLGDSVISLIISEALWQRHPDDDEGSLTTRRAAIVSARGLSRIAQRLELSSYLYLGLGASAAFPLILGFSGKFPAWHAGVVYSAVVLAGAVGRIVFPYLIGPIAHSAGFRIAIGLAFVLAAACSLLAFFLHGISGEGAAGEIAAAAALSGEGEAAGSEAAET